MHQVLHTPLSIFYFQYIHIISFCTPLFMRTKQHAPFSFWVVEASNLCAKCMEMEKSGCVSWIRSAFFAYSVILCDVFLYHNSFHWYSVEQNLHLDMENGIQLTKTSTFGLMHWKVCTRIRVWDGVDQKKTQSSWCWALFQIKEVHSGLYTHTGCST
jgi:hypothetical protein